MFRKGPARRTILVEFMKMMTIGDEDSLGHLDKVLKRK